MNTCKKLRLSLVLAATSMLMASAAAAALTASTSLTVVNVTNFLSPGASAVVNYTQDWPVVPSDTFPPTGQELYIKKVAFTSHNISWSTTPYPTPYRLFGNGLNSMLVAVWSKDKGKTFSLQSWDYLRPGTTGKHMERGMPDCWMGTMIHTICDRKAGECNGRYRSNLYFAEYPSGNTSCWGTVKE